MKSRAEYEKLLTSLKENATTIEVNGLPIEVRDCYDRKTGKVDPRTKAAAMLTPVDFTQDNTEVDPELLGNKDHLFMPENADTMTQLEIDRAWFGWTSIDYSTGIRTKYVTVDLPSGKVRLAFYEKPEPHNQRPCMVWIHGGGFYAGDIYTNENQCKWLADRMNGLVISIDYPLAPETKYPGALNICYDALKWIYAHAEDYAIDVNRIGISGDSAGASLAFGCALKDRDEKSGILSFLCLIYPVVDLTKTLEESEFWHEEDYDNPDDDPMISQAIRFIGTLIPALWDHYFSSDEDKYEQYASPIRGDLSNLPKTLFLLSEYDYLRMEGEACAKKMKDSGVDVHCIRYGGIFHATFDRMNYAPQVEDMLNEMAEGLLGI